MEQMEQDLKELVKRVDYVLIDATFYKNGEIPNRDMSEIPHPFVEESISNFSKICPTKDKAKVIFIHFNHTNPLIEKFALKDAKFCEKALKSRMKV